MMRILYSGSTGFFLGLSQTAYDDPFYEPLYWAVATLHVANGVQVIRDGVQENISLTVQTLCALSNLMGVVLGRLAGTENKLCGDDETLIHCRGFIR